MTPPDGDVAQAGHPAPAGELADVIAPRPVLRSDVLHRGMVWDLVEEETDLGAAGVVRRQFLRHPGAVTVAALDEQDQLLMLQQYRHPAGMLMWELPAGLLDVAGEPPVEAAGRELAEEADLRADRWDLLAEWMNSPGGSNEANRVYLARGLSAVPEDERHVRTGEELDMPIRWVPLDEARDAVLAGRVHNPGAVVGILAVWTARHLGWSTLRPADTPWPAHPAYRQG